MDALLIDLLSLHRPEATEMRGHGLVYTCDHCFTGDPFVTTSMDWPCPTVAVLIRHCGDVDALRERLSAAGPDR